MQKLISENGECADCSHSSVSSIDLYHGVFLCSDCSLVHSLLNFPIKDLTAVFLPEETALLSITGNSVINQKLCRNPKPWFPSPKEFPFPAVRLCWIRAKYRFLAFADADHQSFNRYSLEESWFFLDEMTEESTLIEGPCSRSGLIAYIKEGVRIREESYVWHPILGAKWTVLSKLYTAVIAPLDNIDEDAIYAYYEMRRSLAMQKPPHLRGALDVTTKGKIIRKWVILLNASVYISLPAQAMVVDQVYLVTDLDFDLTEKDGKLLIKALFSSEEMTISAPTSEETLEWFTAFRFSKFMIQTLGHQDFPHMDADLSEQHICNVKSSINYMGNKVKEGLIRKEGSTWKTVKTRWFVLRTQGLYYYKTAEEKSPLGMMSLKRASFTMAEQYRFPNHFSVTCGDKTLHMWTEDTSSKESWMNAIRMVINLLNEETGSETIAQPQIQ